MASKGLFGVPARPRRAEYGARRGGKAHRRIATTVVGALSCALVLMGGLAFADSATPTPDPASATTVAAEPEATTPVEPTEAPEERLDPEPAASPTAPGPVADLSDAPADTEPSGPVDEPSAAADQASVGATRVEPGAMVPFATSSTMDVIVRKRVMANPTSVNGSVSTNTGSDYSFTNGAVFRLYANNNGSVGSAVTDSWATCTVSGGGE